MPLYAYSCPDCGPFSELRSMAEAADPALCPACGASAPREVSAPMLAVKPKGGAARRAHRAGCGCCSPGRGFKAEAAKPVGPPAFLR
jgi:putative FmdB family regulatory protein